MGISYHKLDLHNINANKKFGENPFKNTGTTALERSVE